MADKRLFPRLKRLFSTDVVIRNVGGNSLKIIDVNKIQQTGNLENNALVDRYNRIYTNSPTSLYGKQFNMNYQSLRPLLYSEYDAMDSDAIISSALDIIADECTLRNDFQEVLSIKSSDENVQKILYNLFYDILNIEFNLWSWIRNMCKYGDFFLKLEISEKFGVYNIIPYSSYNMERIEGQNPEKPSEVRFKYLPEGLSTGGMFKYNPNDNSENDFFENYEIAHFRLQSDVNYLPYGKSYIENGRKLYKQYSLMKDAMLVHRIVRAPEKRIHYMNIGAIPPNEVDSFMEKTISKLKRTPHIDPETGDYNLRYNINNLLEDYYIPVRGNDTATKIDTLAGLQWEGIKDVEFLRDELFAALKIPRAFMGYTAELEGKSTLAAQDVRFARTIERIQRITVSELYKIAIIHLYVQGFRDAHLTNFELSLTPPSIIYQQERVALLKEKVDLAVTLIDNKILPSDWIYENLFDLSEDVYEEYRDLIREDAKRAFRITQISTEGNDPILTGRSYGTPHDIATLYGKGRMVGKTQTVPTGYDENEPVGRPQEKASFINTQEDPMGMDRLGTKKEKIEKKIGHTYKGGSPLSLEGLNSKKLLIFENEQRAESLLDENNLNINVNE